LGKGKKLDKRIATLEAQLAERHGFDDGFLGHDSTVYSVNVNEHTALSVDVFFACVRVLADLTADADVAEYLGARRLDVPSDLVRRPMASVTQRTWLWSLVAIMAIYNGAYLLREGFGPFRSLRPVAPPRVNWLSNTVVHLDGRDIPWRDLIWLPRMSFPTLTRDLSWTIRLAREAIAAAWAADNYRSDFWEAGGAPSWYLTTDQSLSPTEADNIAEKAAEKRSANPGRPMVFGKGAKPAAMTTDIAAEGASSATSKLGTSIARYFGVPPWLVNVPSEAGSLTYANASAAGLDLVRYTLQPGYAGPIGDALSDELPGQSRVVLDLTHLTRGTILEQAQAYAIATGKKAWMLPSEVRDDLHMPIDMTLDEAGAPAPSMESIMEGVPS
jgi:phage portal protein BeeE